MLLSFKVACPRAFQNKDDNAIAGMTGNATEFTPLPIPDSYESLERSGLDVSSQDTAYLYSAYARDRATGSTTAANFHDAVTLHHMIDRVTATSTAFSD